MPHEKLSRRTFLKITGLGAASIGIGSVACASAGGSALGNTRATSATPARASSEDTDVKLGVASYSLRNFSRAEAIQMTKTLGTRYINFKSVHLPYDASPAEFSAARQ